jgi:hypothetical protein
MADIDVYVIFDRVYQAVPEGPYAITTELPIISQLVSSESVGATVYYKMVGRDSSCPTPTYHSWVVTNSPDFAAASAGSLPCGGPLVDIYIADKWSE